MSTLPYYSRQTPTYRRFEIRRPSYTPSGAANVAANVASLGGRVLLGGVVGKDKQATHLRTARS